MDPQNLSFTPHSSPNPPPSVSSTSKPQNSHNIKSKHKAKKNIPTSIHPKKIYSKDDTDSLLTRHEKRVLQNKKSQNNVKKAFDDTFPKKAQDIPTLPSTNNQEMAYSKTLQKNIDPNLFFEGTQKVQENTALLSESLSEDLSLTELLEKIESTVNAQEPYSFNDYSYVRHPPPFALENTFSNSLFAHILCEHLIEGTSLSGNNEEIVLGMLNEFFLKNSTYESTLFPTLIKSGIDLFKSVKKGPEIFKERLQFYLNKNKPFILAGGWQNKIGGHSMYYLVSPKADGTYTIYIFNKGSGVNHFHPYFIHEGVLKYLTTLQYSGISKDKFLDPIFIHSYWELLRAPRKVDGSDCDYSAVDIYLGLFKCLKNQPDSFSNDFNLYDLPQVGGTCTWASLMALAKLVMPPQQFFRFRYEIGLKALLNYYNRNKNFLAEMPNERELLHQGLKTFARETYEAFQNHSIDKEELKRSYATQHDIKKAINKGKQAYLQKNARARKLNLHFEPIVSQFKPCSIPIFEEKEIKENEQIQPNQNLQIGTTSLPSPIIDTTFLPKPEKIAQFLETSLEKLQKAFIDNQNDELIIDSINRIILLLPVPSITSDTYWPQVPKEQYISCIKSICLISELMLRINLPKNFISGQLSPISVFNAYKGLAIQYKLLKLSEDQKILPNLPNIRFFPVFQLKIALQELLQKNVFSDNNIYTFQHVIQLNSLNQYFTNDFNINPNTSIESLNLYFENNRNIICPFFLPLGKTIIPKDQSWESISLGGSKYIEEYFRLKPQVLENDKMREKETLEQICTVFADFNGEFFPEFTYLKRQFLVGNYMILWLIPTPSTFHHFMDSFKKNCRDLNTPFFSIKKEETPTLTYFSNKSFQVIVGNKVQQYLPLATTNPIKKLLKSSQHSFNSIQTLIRTSDEYSGQEQQWSPNITAEFAEAVCFETLGQESDQIFNISPLYISKIITFFSNYLPKLKEPEFQELCRTLIMKNGALLAGMKCARAQTEATLRQFLIKGFNLFKQEQDNSGIAFFLMLSLFCSPYLTRESLFSNVEEKYKAAQKNTLNLLLNKHRKKEVIAGKYRQLLHAFEIRSQINKLLQSVTSKQEMSLFHLLRISTYLPFTDNPKKFPLDSEDVRMILESLAFIQLFPSENIHDTLLIQQKDTIMLRLVHVFKDLITEKNKNEILNAALRQTFTELLPPHLNWDITQFPLVKSQEFAFDCFTGYFYKNQIPITGTLPSEIIQHETFEDFFGKNNYLISSPAPFQYTFREEHNIPTHLIYVKGDGENKSQLVIRQELFPSTMFEYILDETHKKHIFDSIGVECFSEKFLLAHSVKANEQNQHSILLIQPDTHDILYQIILNNQDRSVVRIERLPHQGIKETLFLEDIYHNQNHPLVFLNDFEPTKYTLLWKYPDQDKYLLELPRLNLSFTIKNQRAVCNQDPEYFLALQQEIFSPTKKDIPLLGDFKHFLVLKNKKNKIKILIPRREIDINKILIDQILGKLNKGALATTVRLNEEYNSESDKTYFSFTLKNGQLYSNQIEPNLFLAYLWFAKKESGYKKAKNILKHFANKMELYSSSEKEIFDWMGRYFTLSQDHHPHAFAVALYGKIFLLKNKPPIGQSDSTSKEGEANQKEIIMSGWNEVSSLYELYSNYLSVNSHATTLKLSKKNEIFLIEYFLNAIYPHWQSLIHDFMAYQKMKEQRDPQGRSSAMSQWAESILSSKMSSDKNIAPLMMKKAPLPQLFNRLIEIAPNVYLNKLRLPLNIRPTSATTSPWRPKFKNPQGDELFVLTSQDLKKAIETSLEYIKTGSNSIYPKRYLRPHTSFQVKFLQNYDLAKDRDSNLLRQLQIMRKDSINIGLRLFLETVFHYSEKFPNGKSLSNLSLKELETLIDLAKELQTNRQSEEIQLAFTRPIPLRTVNPQTLKSHPLPSLLSEEELKLPILNQPLLPQNMIDEVFHIEERDVKLNQSEWDRLNLAFPLNIPRNNLKSKRDYSLNVSIINDVEHIGNALNFTKVSFRKSVGSSSQIPVEKLKEIRLHLNKTKAKLSKISSQLRTHILFNANQTSIEEFAAEQGTLIHGTELEKLTISELILFFGTKRLTLNYLTQRNKHLSEENIKVLNSLITKFLLVETLQQQIQRSLDIIVDLLNLPLESAEKLSIDDVASLNELSQKLLNELTNQRAPYSIQKHPEFLLFEYYSDMLLWPKQIAEFEKMINENGAVNSNLILEIIMASGKTAVFLPILALLNADGKHISTVVVLDSLFPAVQEKIYLQSQGIFKQVTKPMIFNKNTDFSASHLEEIYYELVDIKNERNYVLTTFESLAILKLELWKCLYETSIRPRSEADQFEPKIKWLQDILFLFSHQGKAILDEVDVVLNPMLKVIISLDKTEKIRTEHLDLVSEICNFIFSNPQIRKEFPYLLSRTTEDSFKEIRNDLIENTIPYLAKESNIPSLKPLKQFFLDLKGDKGKQKDVLAFLNGQHTPTHLIKEISQNPILYNLLSLFHGVFTNLLPITLTKEYNTHLGFGTDPNIPIAVPYVANNTPSDAQFANPYKRAIATLLCFNIEGHIPKIFIEAHLKTLYESTLGSSVPIEQSFQNIEFRKLCPFEDITLEKYSLGIDRIVKWINSNPIQMKQYIREHVLSKITAFSHQMELNSQDTVNLFLTFLGFAGSIYNRRTYHKKLNSIPASHIEAQTLIPLLKYTDPNVYQISSRSLSGIVHELFDLAGTNLNSFKAFIDVGSLFNGFSNEAVAKELALQLPLSIKGVIYFDLDDKEFIIEKTENGIKKPILLKDSELNDDRSKALRFTYYDQRHTTGIDLKQAFGANAFISFGKDTSLRDYSQGCYRMRGWGKLDQYLTVVCSDETASIYKQRFNLEENQTLKVIDHVFKGTKQNEIYKVIEEIVISTQDEIKNSLKHKIDLLSFGKIDFDANQEPTRSGLDPLLRRFLFLCSEKSFVTTSIDQPSAIYGASEELEGAEKVLRAAALKEIDQLQIIIKNLQTLRYQPEKALKELKLNYSVQEISFKQLDWLISSLETFEKEHADALHVIIQSTIQDIKNGLFPEKLPIAPENIKQNTQVKIHTQVKLQTQQKNKLKIMPIEANVVSDWNELMSWKAFLNKPVLNERNFKPFEFLRFLQNNVPSLSALQGDTVRLENAKEAKDKLLRLIHTMEKHQSPPCWNLADLFSGFSDLLYQSQNSRELRPFASLFPKELLLSFNFLPLGCQNYNHSLKILFGPNQNSFRYRLIERDVENNIVKTVAITQEESAELMQLLPRFDRLPVSENQISQATKKAYYIYDSRSNVFFIQKTKNATADILDNEEFNEQSVLCDLLNGETYFPGYKGDVLKQWIDRNGKPLVKQFYETIFLPRHPKLSKDNGKQYFESHLYKSFLKDEEI